VRPGGASDDAALPTSPNVWEACFAGEHDDEQLEIRAMMDKAKRADRGSD
jgi:hypothetical protein